KEGAFNNPYYLGSKKAIPLDASDFTLEYFLEKTQQFGSLSLKAFRATEQRFVGLGNGVLQDILFKARINPRTKVQALSSKKYASCIQSSSKKFRR
ncbi:MAG: endonuclease VIII, partial [Bacilli bacterium]